MKGITAMPGKAIKGKFAYYSISIVGPLYVAIVPSPYTFGTFFRQIIIFDRDMGRWSKAACRRPHDMHS
jgi:hypothetical protein